MSHPDEGLLHELLDGALALPARTELERHLTGCADCRARLAEAQAERREADRLVAALPLEPAAVRPLRPPPPPRPAPRGGLDYRWLGLAASALLVVGVGYAALRPRLSPPTATTPDDAVAPAAAPPAAAGPAVPLAPAVEAKRTADEAVAPTPSSAALPRAVRDAAKEQGAADAAGAVAANEALVTSRAARKGSALTVVDTPPRKEERQIELRDLPNRIPTVAPPAPLPTTRYRLEGLDLVRSEALAGGGTRLHYSVDATPVEFDQVPTSRPAPTTSDGRHELRWQDGSLHLVLRSALPPEELARLRQRVK
ncbi:MAG: zf-HC2 domain-containing protein [Gemmatimonadales bacterium]|nr:zf-HC2 domain-containing protein [Gemmatimonadales bacterium]